MPRGKAEQAEFKASDRRQTRGVEAPGTAHWVAVCADARKTPPQEDARRFGEPSPDGRHAQSRYSRTVRQPEDRCGGAIDRGIHRNRWSRDAQGRYTAGLTLLGEKAKSDAGKGGTPFTLVPGNDVEQVLAMQELTGAVVAQIQDTLAPLEPGGETPLSLAISEAVGTDIGAGSSDTAGHVLVVTDGANDQTGGRYVTASAVEDQIARLNGRRRERLRDDVIGFALAADAFERASRMDDVRNLATTTRGNFYEAANETSLIRALRDSLRLLHWQVRGPNAPRESLPLGSSVDLPVPPRGSEVSYDAMLDAGAVAPQRHFSVHAGDAIDLYATVGGRGLEFRPYDGDTEQGIRDARTSILDPSNVGRRLFVAAHMSQCSGDEVRFPVSIHNADPTQYSPRPAEFWFEVRPPGDGGTPLAPFVFYDPSYQAGRTVPVLDLVATQWPAAATQAEIRGWFRFDATTPDVTVDTRSPAGPDGRLLADCGRRGSASRANSHTLTAVTPAVAGFRPHGVS